ncbi:MAG: substrate-binding domain-containing protein, partial [Roseibium sp.]
RAGQKMAQAILKAGYEHIGFMGTKMPLDHRARKRFEGFTEALAKAGVEIEDRAFYSGGSALLKGREMTQEMLERSPDLDFLYYSNDMIGAGGLLYLLDQGIDVPGQIGLAGFNGVELLQGLPRQLATMDACRAEIGRSAAQIIVNSLSEEKAEFPTQITMTPKISYGDTLKRR